MVVKGGRIGNLGLFGDMGIAQNKHLDNLYLTCIDINAAMLEEISNYLSKAGITNFKTIQSPAEDIPLNDNSIDYIFVFNAIHHLNLTEFTGEAARILRDRGSIFIYTRLQSQNGRNIFLFNKPSLSELGSYYR